ncbi:MAG: CFI-box-CTERM domain-containing protein, partial [Archangium sp.]
AFGEDARELDVLRAFRDEVLEKSVAGRAFVDWYYREGPALARFVSKRPLLKRGTRLVLSGITRLL